MVWRRFFTDKLNQRAPLTSFYSKQACRSKYKIVDVFRKDLPGYTLNLDRGLILTNKTLLISLGPCHTPLCDKITRLEEIEYKCGLNSNIMKFEIRQVCFA